MMKKPFVVTILLFHSLILIAQHHPSKPPLSISDNFDQWEKIDKKSILLSNDGKFVVYRIESNISQLNIQSVDKSWIVKVQDGNNAIITENSRKVLFKTPNDTLWIFDLILKNKIPIPNITSFQTTGQGSGQWLAAKSNTDEKKLLLINLKNKKQQQYLNVDQYQFNNPGNILLLTINDTLKLVDLKNLRSEVIHHGTIPENILFDKKGDQILFTSGKGDSTEIYYYRRGMVESEMKLNNSTPAFSENGNYIFFNLEKPDTGKINTVNENKSNVTVLNSMLPNNTESSDKEIIRAAISKNGSKIIILANKFEKIISTATSLNEDYVLVDEDLSPIKPYSDSLSLPSLYLISLKDGRRKLIKNNFIYSNSTVLSPTGKYIVYFDRKNKTHFSFNVLTGVTTNLDRHLPNPVYQEEGWIRKEPAPDYGIGGWTTKDESIFIYDRYDIWKVDPSGIKEPENITSGYGRSTKTVLRFLSEDNMSVINLNNNQILWAFNQDNKDNGFYQLDIKKAKPYCLTMGPDVYTLYRSGLSSYNYLGENGITPIKAKNVDVYVLFKLSSHQSPNLYLSRDFKQQVQLTNIHPEGKYNWMYSELIKYKLNDDKQGEAILYKPENFDSTKKYPIVFYFYEHYSDYKNQFIYPDKANGQLPISSFVSNGYLVCVPNIYYEKGNIGYSIYNSIISAARKMSDLLYVDSTKMGLQGHSYGGYEVNWIVTQTSKFAAGASAAGLSDLVSNYTTTDAGYAISEEGQLRMDASLWKNTEAYIRNSPVFFADKITTPLLIEVGMEDFRVPSSQGVEFYTALKRLQKRAWLLKYPDMGHILVGEAGKDYNIKLMQFFDYYLKNTSEPKWMTINAGY